MDIKRYNSGTEKEVNRSQAFFINHIKDGSTVLELGAAFGALARRLKEKKGCKVTCVEIDPEGARNCSLYAVKVILGDLEGLEWAEELKGEKFDYIVMGDVLEHLRSPKVIVERAKEFLNDGGLLLTSIPNLTHSAVILSLLKGRFDYQPTGLLDFTHIHFFTRYSIAKMFKETGWKCVHEKDSAVLPVLSGMPYSYISLPLWAPFLACRRDAHTLQFKQAWTPNPTPEQPIINPMAWKRGRRPLALIEMMGDIAIFLYNRVIKKKTPPTAEENK